MGAYIVRVIDSRELVGICFPNNQVQCGAFDELRSNSGQSNARNALSVGD
jgi:hypothetical protein